MIGQIPSGFNVNNRNAFTYTHTYLHLDRDMHRTVCFCMHAYTSKAFEIIFVVVFYGFMCLCHKTGHGDRTEIWRD